MPPLEVLLLVAVRAASYLLVCTGFAVVFGSARILNLSHGVFFVIAAYAAHAAGPAGAGLDAVWAWSVAVAGTALIGWIFFRTLLRPAAADPDRCMVLCLAANLAFTEAIKLVAGARAVPVPRLIEGHVSVGDLRMTAQQAAAIPVAAAVAGASAFLLRRTPAGRAIRAVAADPERAALLGVRPERVAAGAFVGSVVLVAIAAALLAPDQVVGPSSWVSPLVKSFAVVVAGGALGMRAVAVASVLLAVTEVATALCISEGAAEYVGLAAVLGGTALRTRTFRRSRVR